MLGQITRWDDRQVVLQARACLVREKREKLKNHMWSIPLRSGFRGSANTCVGEQKESSHSPSEMFTVVYSNEFGTTHDITNSLNP